MFYSVVVQNVFQNMSTRIHLNTMSDLWYIINWCTCKPFHLNIMSDLWYINNLCTYIFKTSLHKSAKMNWHVSTFKTSLPHNIVSTNNKNIHPSRYHLLSALPHRKNTYIASIYFFK